ncbi:hypothetical protein L0B53_02875 [Vibrio sp. SS-MA-C1-2]|uniref:hypothetical protein n=1 Tax=Vibrio sp. SS-MA-C1-2 TaxID=2908646 RepID=UPI001F4482A7|nr:hypothetical protein [Vibrio sp. SS-MA-C1-2]UJF16902.1 hypothetical protein L0B53_02875 [Vibrio sp. SS-MA-C1-2]
MKFFAFFLTLLLSYSVSAFNSDSHISTWVNQSGQWFSCGPDQCDRTIYINEHQALRASFDKTQFTIIGYTRVGKCHIYYLQNDDHASSPPISQYEITQKSEC